MDASLTKLLLEMVFNGHSGRTKINEGQMGSLPGP